MSIFDPEIKKSDVASPAPVSETVSFSFPEEALHVMPQQYQGTASTAKQPKVANPNRNPNAKFFLLIGGLVILLGALIVGFYFYSQYQPAPAPQNNNQPVSQPDTNATSTVPTGPDLTTAEGRDAQRIKDVVTLQQALAAYQAEFLQYPQVLSAIPAKDLLQEPKDPLSNQPYVYTFDNANRSYVLQFVIESQAILDNQVLTAGTHAMGPQGLLADNQLPPAAATSTTPIIPTQPSADTLDEDQDGLTAAEEKSLRTDPKNPDTDGDGFKDGEEVLKLYSPISAAKSFLNASGLVKIYTNTKFNYSLWTVQDWIARSLDTTDREIMLTAPNGDSVTVLAEPNATQEKIDSWYLARHSEEKSATLRRFQVADMPAIKSPDGLAAYFTNGPTIFSVTYRPASGGVAYPTVFQLILSTFRTPADNK